MAVPTLSSTRRAHVRRLLDVRAIAPLGIFLATLLCYLTTLTQVHTFDALSYVTSVERKPWTEQFHPHHLAYGPLGSLALAISQALGYEGGAARPMQIVNATTGALGAAFFFLIVRRVTARADLALLAAVLLAGAYAYWYYAIEIEVYTVAALFLLLCLNLLITVLARPTPRNLLLLGLAQGGAVMFHQTNVLLGVPVLLAILLATTTEAQFAPHAERGVPQRLRDLVRRVQWSLAIRRGLWYGVPLGLMVALPYLFVGVVVSGFRSWSDFENWLFDYARTGWWGGPITTQKWTDLGQGLAETVAQPGGALLGLLLLGLLLARARSLWAGPGRLLLVLGSWLLVYGAFFLWWEPDNIEFWIASLPPALLILALALRGERRWGPGVWLGFAIAVTIVGINYDSIKRRGDPTTDLQRVVSASLGQQSRPADLLLVPDGLIELYLPYYEGHDNFLSLNQALFDSRADWDSACATAHTRIEAALHAGATALIAGEVLRPPPEVMTRHNLTQSQVDACFAPYLPALQPLTLPANVPDYYALPDAAAHLAGEGWRFQSYSQGWSTANVAEGWIDGGWTFTPGIDPYLTSPLLGVDAAAYRAIEIRLANRTRAYDAQLFYAGPDEQVREEHSVRWTLEPTADAVTYTIDLTDAPGWAGTISRLRFDPVGVGDGGSITVESIRLIPAP